ncbi:MAG: peptidoglycan DD-metalloendopeptidase family protein, partial [Acidobacteriota bacterium]|nr:peptidoglycan DD-metalloendopeptidase family protein [Acidobacteriota bacterium]
ELLPLPLIRSTRHDGGVIESSVAQALGHLPNGASVTAAFADVMQWDVDLYVDPRPGDAVRLVYEVLTLGAVPTDLPHFGSAARETGEFVSMGRILAARYHGAVASAEGFWVADGSSAGDFYDRDGQPLRKSFLKSPLNYRRISSRFSRNRLHPVTRRVSPHHGVDFAAAPGTPVVATADGRVARAGWDGPLGRAVRVRHNGEYTTIYGHFQRLARGIRPGVSVKQNQVIGFVGSSGRATGPHLHYTVLRNKRPIDPMRMDNPSREPLAPSLRPWLDQAADRWGDHLHREDPIRERERQIASTDDGNPTVGVGS